ncbi:hypothetical protein HZA45_00495 [Candidatus Peregrinibacteria bacterium]|nr:hypothetical protein [Candidatus Peregrinibacteria bacterium]
MSIFSRFLPAAPNNNNPPANNDPESVEKMRKSVRTLNQQQLAKLLNQFERNRRQLSTEQLQIIEDHLNDLRGRSQDAAHQQLISLCDARLKILQERMANGTASPHPEGDGGPGRNSGVGVGAMIGAGVGASILAWLGFNVHRRGLFGGTAATARSGWRGLFGLTSLTTRTGVNTLGFAFNNPILAAMGIGVGAGVTKNIVDYMQQNRNSLIQEIEGIARERGIEPERVAQDIGHRIGDYIRSAGSSTVDTFVKGVVWVCRGTINPETGAITLPHATLTPPFFTAYKAGMRSRASGGAVVRYLEGFRLNPFQSTEKVAAGMADAIGHQSLDRIDQIKAVNIEIEKIRKTDPVRAAKLEKEFAKALNVTVGSSDMNKIVSDATNFDIKNRTTYTNHQELIHKKILECEEAIRTGKGIPNGQSVEEFKTASRKEIDKLVKAQHSDLAAKKIDLGQQYVDGMNTRTKARMDKQGGGYIDGTRRAMENAGYKFTQIPGGKWILRGAVGYSMMPLAMEAASATMNTLEGNVKEKRLKEKKDAGHTLSENEEKELHRLENQWKAVGWDIAQVGGGFIPGIGEFIDFKGAITGKDLNDRDLDTMSRVTMGVMGGLGTASLALAPFTGGVSVLGFRVIRGASAAGKGLKAAKNLEKSNQTIDASTKAIDAAKKMATVTRAQKAAMTGRNALQMARNGMQIYTYGMLGYSLTCGAVDFVQHNRIGEIKERAAGFVEHLGDHATEHIPGYRPVPNQAPSESSERPAI